MGERCGGKGMVGQRGWDTRKSIYRTIDERIEWEMERYVLYLELNHV